MKTRTKFSGTHYDVMDSPVGELTIVVSSKGLHAILWDCDDDEVKQLSKLIHDKKHPLIVQIKKQLLEYFSGKRKIFDLPLVIEGTEFQRQTWKQLQKIPYAETISYGEQARRLGDKNKSRAVGMANGCNPISIIVPCHRVIGSNGKLVGFGGGLSRKEWLLQHEKKHA